MRILLNWVKNGSLALLACLFSFISAEVFTRLTLGNPYNTSGAVKRVMLFEAGRNFENKGELFRYYPNMHIRSEAYYISENKLTHELAATQEYVYVIKTNNLGLVQRTNISQGASVHLVLGDSFTEGQGVIPWFYDLESEYVGTRHLINGGLLGTGPLQWKRLAEDLESESKVRIDGLTVVIIGPDLMRPIWNFSEDALRCLHQAQCQDIGGDFFGYEFSEKPESEILDDVMELYNNRMQVDASKTLPNNIKTLVKKSAFLTNLYITFVRPHFGRGPGKPKHKDVSSMLGLDVVRRNIDALDTLATAYSNVSFLLVNYKDEAHVNEWSGYSERIIEAANDKGWALSKCWLDPTDFRVSDSHPNENGYMKLRECVSDTISFL